MKIKWTVLPLLAVNALCITNLAVCEEISKTIGLTYPDKVSSEYLKEVLISLNIPFSERETKNGQYVTWESNNEDQEREIQDRVSQYRFLKVICKSDNLPPPGSPSKESLSCE